MSARELTLATFRELSLPRKGGIGADPRIACPSESRSQPITRQFLSTAAAASVAFVDRRSIRLSYWRVPVIAAVRLKGATMRGGAF